MRQIGDGLREKDCADGSRALIEVSLSRFPYRRLRARRGLTWDCDGPWRLARTTAQTEGEGSVLNITRSCGLVGHNWVSTPDNGELSERVDDARLSCSFCETLFPLSRGCRDDAGLAGEHLGGWAVWREK